MTFNVGYTAQIWMKIKLIIFVTCSSLLVLSSKPLTLICCTFKPTSAIPCCRQNPTSKGRSVKARVNKRPLLFQHIPLALPGREINGHGSCSSAAAARTTTPVSSDATTPPFHVLLVKIGHIQDLITPFLSHGQASGLPSLGMFLPVNLPQEGCSHRNKPPSLTNFLVGP
jgi:hypothetical protein